MMDLFRTGFQGFPACHSGRDTRDMSYFRTMSTIFGARGTQTSTVEIILILECLFTNTYSFRSSCDSRGEFSRIRVFRFKDRIVSTILTHSRGESPLTFFGFRPFMARNCTFVPYFVKNVNYDYVLTNDFDNL